MPQSTGPSKAAAEKNQDTTAEDIQAQIDVSVAHVRQLVSSWLPPMSPAEAAAAAKDAPTLQDEISAAKAASASKRSKHSSTEALRKTLMGSSKAAAHSKTQHAAHKPVTTKKHQLQESDADSDEETGRASLVKPKRVKTKASGTKKKTKQATSTPADIPVAVLETAAQDAPSSRKKNKKNKTKASA